MYRYHDRIRVHQEDRRDHAQLGHLDAGSGEVLPRRPQTRMDPQRLRAGFVDRLCMHRRLGADYLQRSNRIGGSGRCSGVWQKSMTARVTGLGFFPDRKPLALMVTGPSTVKGAV